MTPDERREQIGEMVIAAVKLALMASSHAHERPLTGAELDASANAAASACLRRAHAEDLGPVLIQVLAGDEPRRVTIAFSGPLFD
jgi:hypothetical protein